MTKSAWKRVSIKTLRNIIGLILFITGLLDWLVHTNIVPESLQFNNYPIVLIIAGILIVFRHKHSFHSLNDPDLH